MIGILLAGGEGTRLRPFTNHFNKHFYPVFDKPMVYYSLRQFELIGLKKVFVVCKKKDRLKFKEIINFYFNFLEIIFINQEKPLGAMHAISICKSKLKCREVVINMGDHFLFDFKKNMQVIEAIKKYKNIIFCIQSKKIREFGNLKFDEKNQFEKVIEKPKKKYSNFILTGLMKVSTKIIPDIQNLKKSKRNEYEVANFINDNYKYFNCIKLQKNYLWTDMGTFERIRKLSDQIRNNGI